MYGRKKYHMCLTRDYQISSGVFKSAPRSDPQWYDIFSCELVVQVISVGKFVHAPEYRTFGFSPKFVIFFFIRAIALWHGLLVMYGTMRSARATCDLFEQNVTRFSSCICDYRLCVCVCFLCPIRDELKRTHNRVV